MFTSKTTPARPELGASLTVNALIAWYPSVLPALNEFGIDTCCGGADSLELAAHAASIPLDDLMRGIAAAVERTAPENSQGATLPPTAGAGR